MLSETLEHSNYEENNGNYEPEDFEAFAHLVQFLMYFIEMLLCRIELRKLLKPKKKIIFLKEINIVTSLL